MSAPFWHIPSFREEGRLSTRLLCTGAMAPPKPPRSLFATPEPALDGEVLRVVYSDTEKGWAVIRFLLSNPPTRITAVGTLFGVQAGERLRLTGHWVQDPKFGRQFRVDTYLSLMPSTLQGIERYLGSGLIPGIGPVMASRLVERFGLETLDVIENQPDRLPEVSGIGVHRVEKIRGAWQRQKGIREVMVFLQSHGITVNQAVKIYRRYGVQSVAAIRANPYRLAEDIFGFGFQTADQIAGRLGVDREAPARVAAGVLHVLGRGESQGHVYLPEGRLIEDTVDLLEVTRELVVAALTALLQQQRIVVEPGSTAAAERAVYRPRLYEAEVGIANRLRQVLDQGASEPSDRPTWESDLNDFESLHSMTFSKQQREAIQRSLVERALVITGGPGTGKTTLIRAVVDLHARHGHRILLAAPTGRAAKRLNEATGFEAKTLHRLLEFQPSGMTFQRHRGRPLEADLVIVDETSMLDCSLAGHLFDALADDCRLILVGDVDQLPSVGPGRVLADLISSRRVPVVKLVEVFRQASRSLIVENAHRIRGGQMPRLETEHPVDFYLIERDRPEAILETIEHLLAERIPRRFGFDARQDIQVLAPMRRGQVGVESLNRQVQQLLASDQPPVEITGGRLRQQDRVMQTRNNYDLEVFNGDIGHVVGASDDDESLIVEFYGRRVRYPVADTDQLVLAYASSIHKAQGSEYRCVVIPLHSSHYIMLQRNLLYTAVTRGRQLVIVVGEKRALAQAIRNDRQQVRFTRLAERLR